MRKWYCAVMGCALLVFASKAYAPPSVPEFDGGSAVSALGVLSVVIALAAERLRRK